MNNFKIFFKKSMILKVNGTKKMFDANKYYAFSYMSDKETDILRTLALTSPDDMVFYLTNDFTGCYDIVYGYKKPKDITTTNILKQNRGRKNKKQMPIPQKNVTIDVDKEEDENE